MTKPEEVKAVVDSLNITMTAKFVPFSQSRYKAEKTPGLNWIVTLSYKGREFLTTDYGAGQAHCPSYKQGSRLVIDEKVIRAECEHGRKCQWSDPQRAAMVTYGRRETVMPNREDVLRCLLSDAEAIDYSTFEEWAANFDYAPDSRKAEAIYRACLETGLKMRSSLGEAVMTQLREAFQDY